MTKVYAFEDSFIFFYFAFDFIGQRIFVTVKSLSTLLLASTFLKPNKIVISQPYLKLRFLTSGFFYDKVIREIRYNKFYYNSFESFSVGKRREK